MHPTKRTLELHAHLGVVGRTQLKNRSSIGYGAYMHHARYCDVRDGEVYDHRHGPERAVPSCLLGYPGTSEQLWQEVEIVEDSMAFKPLHAQTAYSLDFAFPRELTSEACWSVFLCVSYWLHKEYGVVVDGALHGMGGLNPHCHMGFTQRQYDVKTGRWSRCKIRDFVPHEGDGLLRLRRQIAVYLNAALREEKAPAAVEWKSFAKRGLNRIPTRHEGVKVHRMRKRGVVVRAAADNVQIKILNAKLEAQGSALKPLANAPGYAIAQTDLANAPSLSTVEPVAPADESLAIAASQPAMAPTTAEAATPAQPITTVVPIGDGPPPTIHYAYHQEQHDEHVRFYVRHFAQLPDSIAAKYTDRLVGRERKAARRGETAAGVERRLAEATRRYTQLGRKHRHRVATKPADGAGSSLPDAARRHDESRPGQGRDTGRNRAGKPAPVRNLRAAHSAQCQTHAGDLGNAQVNGGVDPRKPELPQFVSNSDIKAYAYQRLLRNEPSAGHRSQTRLKRSDVEVVRCGDQHYIAVIQDDYTEQVCLALRLYGSVDELESEIDYLLRNQPLIADLEFTETDARKEQRAEPSTTRERQRDIPVR